MSKEQVNNVLELAYKGFLPLMMIGAILYGGYLIIVLTIGLVDKSSNFCQSVVADELRVIRRKQLEDISTSQEAIVKLDNLSGQVTSIAKQAIQDAVNDAIQQKTRTTTPVAPVETPNVEVSPVRPRSRRR